MAESSSDQQLRNRNDPFTLVSPELITNIICQLPSLSDALIFSATCYRHRQIYSDNVTHIYTHIASKTIMCRRDARNLLADQGGAAANSRVLSVHDVSQLLRNNKRVEKAMDQFNRDIVCRVRTGVRADEFYGTPKHPPQLTHTERPRFIRSYYQLWGYMRLEAASKRQRLEGMTLKQLYTLHEIASLRQCISDETDWDSAQKRWCSLPLEIWQLIQRTYIRVHKKEPVYIWVFAKEEGASPHLVMFDHYQFWFKEAVCNRSAPLLKRNPVSEFWEETDEEE